MTSKIFGRIQTCHIPQWESRWPLSMKLSWFWENCTVAYRG